jgi:hypothetical protein
MTRRFIVQHDQRRHRPGSGGGGDGSVIGQSQIVAEPDEMRG